MSTNEFDEAIRKGFDRHEFPYNPSQWDRLAGRLPGARVAPVRRWWLGVTGIAAAIALLLLVRYAAVTPPVSRPTAGKTPVSPSNPLPAAPLQQAAPHTVTAADEATAYVPAPLQVMVPMPHIIIGSKRPPVTGTVPKGVAQSQGQVVITEVEGLPTKQETHGDQAPEQQFSHTFQPHFRLFNAPAAAAISFSDEPAYDPPAAERKTSISLAGGVNYSALHTGYTLGFNARHQLDEHFYVEGDIAFANNHNSQQTANVTSNDFNRIQNGFSAITLAKSEPVPTTSNLYYMQVTPVVGYRIKQHISLGVGADIQRLLQHESSETIIYTDNSVKQIPVMDYGVVGKTEYAVTRRLKAGFLYREGLVNVFKSGNTYINRRYMQVQLKWAIVR